MASVWVFAKPPAGSSGQDALGLITIYPRPDELHSSLLLPITHHSQPPSIPPFFQGFDPASTAAFPIQEHLTIRCGGCQHNHEINRITVYPFIHKRVNRYLKILWAENTSSAHNILSLKSESCDNTEENIHDVEWNKCYNISIATLILFLTAK